MTTYKQFALTVVFWAVIWLAISLAMFEGGHQMRAKAPIYEERITSLDDRVGVFLSAHGVQSTKYSIKNLYSHERIFEFVRGELPNVIGFFSDRLLVFLLGLGFLIEMAQLDSAKSGLLARKLVYYGRDTQRFISISARTAAINAMANLVLLVVLGVDFAVIWCFLYFFLAFIPSIGFVIALVPPILIALLMLGWKRALLVGGGLICTQMMGDYVINPMLMKKGQHVSFLDEIMLSLLIWSHLPGPAGALLAMPLTLAVRRFMEKPFTEEEGALAEAPG